MNSYHSTGAYCIADELSATRVFPLVRFLQATYNIDSLISQPDGDAKMGNKAQHVVPNGAGWSVRKAGSSRATKTFDTEAEAITEGRKIARSQGTVLFIHGRDWRIRERASYGSDPTHSRG